MIKALLTIVLTVTTFLNTLEPNNLEAVIDNLLQQTLTTHQKIMVIDGDTIRLINGQKVRYIGIDTPEENECFYDQAKAKNQELVSEGDVSLAAGKGDRDRYGRLLRYVYVKDCNKHYNAQECEPNNTLFVNKYLIKNGYAQLMQIKPNTKYKELFTTLENKAKEQKLGLWGDCY